MSLNIEGFAKAAESGLLIDSPYRYSTTGEHVLGELAAFASNVTVAESHVETPQDSSWGEPENGAQ